MEQALGHVTHYQNLRHWVSADGSVAPEWALVEYNQPDIWQSLPGFRSNWTLRASMRARSLVHAAMRTRPPDSLFFHTQVTALFSRSFMRRRATIVSLDATPVNMDSVGDAYDHRPSRSAAVEAVKAALSRSSFRSAAHLTTWNNWAKESLVRDYGIAPEKVTVVSPGVDLGRWSFERYPKPKGSRIRLLFVGGDFRRKGGEMLLSVFRKHLTGLCDLDIVTREEVDVSGIEGARVHHGLTSNSDGLMALYAAADCFVLPTHGECHPVAAIEALAAGLPVIITDVGSTREIVEDGTVGYVIDRGCEEQLVSRIIALTEDADARYCMSRRARKRAEMCFDGAANYGSLIDLAKRAADGRFNGGRTDHGG